MRKTMQNFSTIVLSSFLFHKKFLQSYYLSEFVLFILAFVQMARATNSSLHDTFFLCEREGIEKEYGKKIV